jgi:poly(hydroxyalkanoate) depolymerase family esterase
MHSKTDLPQEGKSMKANSSMLEFVRDITHVMLSTAASDTAATADQRPVTPQQETFGQAQFLTGSHANEAGTRTYKLYVPSAYRGQPLPLVVMLHGCRQDPDDFAAGTRMNLLAEEQHCLVAYPGQSRGANALYCWNWFSALDQRRDQGEPAIIAGITRELIADWNIDRSRVYVAGLSSGAAMAVIMGAAYPDLYAAIGVHSGMAYAGAHNVHSALLAMRNGAAATLRHPDHGFTTASGADAVATSVFHGDMDTTVHPDNADQVIAQSVPNPGDSVHAEPGIVIEHGAVPDGHAYTRTIHQNSDGDPVAEHWLVHGAGHAWSGGSVDGSFTDPLGPDATREMLRFFLGRRQAA